MKSDEVYNRLAGSGIKPSVQRLAIMEYLMSHNTHPTVETVYQALSKKIPTLSVTTVYNTLRLFAGHGVAQMVTIDERRVCYDGVTEPHVHFYCKQCGRVFDVYSREAPGIPEGILPEGHRVDEAHLYYKGVCAECMEKDR